MQMLIEFDIDADIVEVPQFVVEDRELYRRRFLKWLYDKSIKHKYWVTFSDGTRGLCYRSDAFLEWLNKKVLKNTEKARLVAEAVNIDEHKHLPSIFFLITINYPLSTINYIRRRSKICLPRLQ